jgi:hypothetical protein
VEEREGVGGKEGRGGGKIKWEDEVKEEHRVATICAAN